MSHEPDERFALQASGLDNMRNRKSAFAVYLVMYQHFCLWTAMAAIAEIVLDDNLYRMSGIRDRVRRRVIVVLSSGAEVIKTAATQVSSSMPMRFDRAAIFCQYSRHVSY